MKAQIEQIKEKIEVRLTALMVIGGTTLSAIVAGTGAFSTARTTRSPQAHRILQGGLLGGRFCACSAKSLTHERPGEFSSRADSKPGLPIGLPSGVLGGYPQPG